MAGVRWTSPPTATAADQAATCVRHTDGVDGPHHLHPVVPRQRLTCQRPPAPSERRQALPQRGVEPLNVGRVDAPTPMRAVPARLDARGRALHDTAFDGDQAPLGLALHDLREAEGAPPGARAAPSARAHETSRESLARLRSTHQYSTTVGGAPHSGGPAR